jgi:hypothetical protein
LTRDQEDGGELAVNPTTVAYVEPFSDLTQIGHVAGQVVDKGAGPREGEERRRDPGLIGPGWRCWYGRCAGGAVAREAAFLGPAL